MAVSKETAERVAAVIKQYVIAHQIAPLIQQLKEIPGNKSYRETVEMLDQLLKEGKL